MQRIAAPPPGTVVSASLVADASGVSVGWTELSGGVSPAYARVNVTDAGPAPRITLAEDAEQLEGVAGLAAGPVWIVDRPNGVLGTRELRVLRTDPLGALEQIISLPNPYTGYFAALATSASEVVVVGPEFDPDPARPVVRSLLLRLSTACH